MLAPLCPLFSLDDASIAPLHQDSSPYHRHRRLFTNPHHIFTLLILWTVAACLFAIAADGIELHPALLAAAAATPLDAGARFDETGMKRLLSNRIAGAAGAGAETGVAGQGATR